MPLASQDFTLRWLKPPFVSTPSRNTFVFVVFLCGAIAAGCAGGSGGAPRIPVPPGGGGVTFPPPPPPVPTNNSWQPSPPPGFSNAYFYSGVITTKYVRPPVVQTPTPNPNPTVSAEFVQTSNISSTVTGLQTFPLTNQPGLVDFQTAEADTGVIGQLNLVNTFSNNYYQYSADANPKLTDVYEVGSIAERRISTTTSARRIISSRTSRSSGLSKSSAIDSLPRLTDAK